MIAFLLATALASDVPITGPQAEDAARRTRPASVPDDDTLVAAGAVVGEVRVTTLDIFDPSKPGEDRAIFRAANKVHPRTRPNTVRRLLLFEPGDRYDPEQLAESERILRASGYLYDAWIRPIGWDGTRVDIEVVTRDVWTLTLGIGYSRSGGENRTRIGIEDSNLLGTGKEVTLRRTSDVDRTQVLYRYRDPNIAGKWWRFEIAYGDNSDGQSHSFDLARPFYSLDTPWSAGVFWRDDDFEDALWEAGEEFANFRHRRQQGDLFAGFSRGPQGERVVRWTGGYAWDRDRFAPVPDAFAPPQVFNDRTFGYPYLEVEQLPISYVRARDIDRVVRTEDLRLGTALFARLGWAAPAFGSEHAAAILRGTARRASTPGEEQLLVMEGLAEGRWPEGGVENVLVDTNLRFYRRNFGRHAFYFRIGAAAAVKLDPDRQLLIGGDSGLRGYPLRFQSGDRRLLVTVEQRFYTDWHVLKLLYVGAAVFADVGRAWYAGRQDLDRPWLKDVGVGLRVGSSRSAKGAMVHIDLSWAIDAPPGISRTQITIETREKF
ncbi:MAG TPA: POTRA domain-containing protein [Candidatus Polarisedimenticolaceae bacterium]